MIGLYVEAEAAQAPLFLKVGLWACAFNRHPWILLCPFLRSL